MRCGLVFVHRWSALNERQRVLFERLAGGEEPGAWTRGEWRSTSDISAASAATKQEANMCTRYLALDSASKSISLTSVSAWGLSVNA